MSKQIFCFIDVTGGKYLSFSEIESIKNSFSAWNPRVKSIVEQKDILGGVQFLMVMESDSAPASVRSVLSIDKAMVSFKREPDHFSVVEPGERIRDIQTGDEYIVNHLHSDMDWFVASPPSTPNAWGKSFLQKEHGVSWEKVNVSLPTGAPKRSVTIGNVQKPMPTKGEFIVDTLSNQVYEVTFVYSALPEPEFVCMTLDTNTLTRPYKAKDHMTTWRFATNQEAAQAIGAVTRAAGQAAPAQSACLSANATNCPHTDVKQYRGFTDSFNYCGKCGEKLTQTKEV